MPELRSLGHCLHAVVLRSSTTLRRHPRDHAVGIHDVARLAVHAVGVLELCPAYGGSLIMRAPFALAADAFGGGEVAVFRAVAVPCLLAGAALAVVLAASLLARGAGRGTVAIVVGLCAANPITLRALDIGHPEELLGAVLCAGAVLAALRGRSTLAGVLLGLADRQQGVGAARGRAGAARAARPTAGARSRSRARSPPRSCCRCCWPRAPSAQPGAAVQTGAIFQPWQVWWFLGSTGEVIRGADGRRQGGLPRGSRLGVADQPPADRRRRAAAVAAGLAPALGPAAAARAAVRAALRARPLEHRLLRAARDHRAGGVGGDAHRAPAGVRARADDGDVGDLGVGRARRVAPTSRRSSTSPGACRSSACWPGGSTRRRCPRCPRSARAAGRASGARRSSAR